MRDIKRERPPLKHHRMPIAERAKQFGAFDPLSGFGEAIRKKEAEMEELLSEETEHIPAEETI